MTFFWSIGSEVSETSLFLGPALCEGGAYLLSFVALKAPNYCVQALKLQTLTPPPPQQKKKVKKRLTGGPQFQPSIPL